MIDELRAQIRSAYKPDFDFTTIEDVPFTPAASPQRIALISTAGLYLEHHQPFDRARSEGDASFRRIRVDDDLSRARFGWESPASQDVNCAFPLALLPHAAPMHYSFSGSIPDPRPLIEETAPEVARELHGLGVDAVVVAPS